jgi:hypothetical protein
LQVRKLLIRKAHWVDLEQRQQILARKDSIVDTQLVAVEVRE